MTQIILDDAQAQAIAQARDIVVLRDRAGNYLGSVQPEEWTSEDIALATARLNSNQPSYTTQQVLERRESATSRSAARRG